jgi:glycerol uptake facilitator protein
MEEKVNWWGRYIGEAVGVWAIIFFGDGLLHSAVLIPGTAVGIWQASIGWGIAVALAIWLGGSLSGAHFNPGVTIALAWRRGFPWSQVIPFIVAQIFGGFVGAMTLGVIWSSTIRNFIVANNIVKSEPSGLLLALMYSPYGPHPGFYGINTAATWAEANAMAAQAVPWLLVAVAEFVVTAILFGTILNFIDENQTFKPGGLFPWAVGLLVAALVFAEAPLSMISMNAARDLGPRIWLLFNGYGYTAFPGPQAGGSLIATTIVPILGACFGAWFHDTLVAPHMGKA